MFSQRDSGPGAGEVRGKIQSRGLIGVNRRKDGRQEFGGPRACAYHSLGEKEKDKAKDGLEEERRASGEQIL